MLRYYQKSTVIDYIKLVATSIMSIIVAVFAGFMKIWFYKNVQMTALYTNLACLKKIRKICNIEIHSTIKYVDAQCIV